MSPPNFLHFYAKLSVIHKVKLRSLVFISIFDFIEQNFFILLYFKSFSTVEQNILLLGITTLLTIDVQNYPSFEIFLLLIAGILN